MSWCCCPGGKMVFCGPSDEGLRYFGKERWADVYRAFRAEPERDWPGEFRQSPGYQQYVAGGLAGQVPESARSAAEPPPAPRSRLAQLAILCRRYVALITADRSFLIWMAALPVVLGALIGLTAKDLGLIGPRNANAQTTLLFLVIVASFTGGFSSVRELVRSLLVWLLFMVLTCPLASCPETGHSLFVSTRVANSRVAQLALR